LRSSLAVVCLSVTAWAAGPSSGAGSIKESRWNDLTGSPRIQGGEDIERNVFRQEMDRAVGEHDVGSPVVEGVHVALVRTVDGARPWFRKSHGIDALKGQHRAVAGPGGPHGGGGQGSLLIHRGPAGTFDQEQGVGSAIRYARQAEA